MPDNYTIFKTELFYWHERILQFKRSSVKSKGGCFILHIIRHQSRTTIVQQYRIIGLMKQLFCVTV